jgi:predicted transposase
MKNKLTFTVTGEWFPEYIMPVTPKTKDISPQQAIDTEMRLFCSCMRWACNRLLENNTRKELKKQGQKMFNLNSRYVDDAILKAKEIIDSQKALLPLNQQETEKKLKRAQKKLKLAEKSLVKARVKNNTSEIEHRKLIVKGRQNRVRKLNKKLSEINTHLENKTIPKIVFGGRTLWKKKCKNQITKETWRRARQNRLYSRGDTEKGGNPNLKLDYQNGEFYLIAGI